MNVVGVIVTYNRKELLVRSISAVLDQTLLPQRLIIVDNVSSDGTFEMLCSRGFASSSGEMEVHGTVVEYLRLEKNVGGAGGFHHGIKRAVEHDADFVWIMDDDGFPAPDCLEQQMTYTDQYDYVMPVSLDPEKKGYLSFPMKKKKGRTQEYAELCAAWPTGVAQTAMPFNGLLLSRRIIADVGLPMAEMFIWGDEWNHQLRCLKAGYTPVSVLSALFYHPRDRSDHDSIFFGLIPINYNDSKLRFTCLIRNSSYNYWRYKGVHYLFAKWAIYTWFFIVQRKFAFREYIYYLQCVRDGIRGDFTRHIQYLEKK